MTFKKIVLSFLVLLSVFLLIGCKEEDKPNEEEKEQEQEKISYVVSLYTSSKDLYKEITIDEEHNEVKLEEIEEPTKDGYIFSGWYNNPDGRYDKVESVDLSVGENIKLYAKWDFVKYQIEYELYGGECVYLKTERTAFETVDLPTPTLAGANFLGWYDNASYEGEVLTVLDKNNLNVTKVYAKWDIFNVHFELNGGNMQYESRSDVVASLLADYNKANKTSYTLSTLPKGAWDGINFHSFLYTDNYRSKWSWLVEYLSVVGSSANKAGCAAILQYDTADAYKKANSNYIYEVSYEFRGFMLGIKFTSNANYPSSDYSSYELANGFWNYLNKAKNPDLLKQTAEVTLPTPKKENYDFGGWYDNPQFTGDAYTKADRSVNLYAKWNEKVPVTDIAIESELTEIERYSTLQLVWKVLPEDAGIQDVFFSSSDENIATVSSSGLVTFSGVGKVTVTITSLAPSRISSSLEVNVFSPSHFELSYETNSYVQVGDTIKLNAKYIKKDQALADISWESLDPDIATVNEGVVTGVNPGLAHIKVSANNEEKEFVVTVLANDLSSILKFIVSCHESNAYTSFDLGIGAGTPAYYMDIIGSVSDILFNEKLSIDDQCEEAQRNNTANYGSSSLGITKRPSTEFITVHYTGNMSAGATALANAKYFSTEKNSSIHYVTGNDGVFSVLGEDLIGWHAGDGTQVRFTWTKTGVSYSENDPTYPVWGISSDSYFTINGQKTSIAVPAGTTAATKKVTDSKWINDMGLPFRVVNGEYEMGTVWWCYSQIAEGRICSKGGNLNSVGIESAVNANTDLWYTWQKTAQLVSYLLEKYDLDITRVVGHHFYSAKNCPQPLLENDLDLWWKFIEMVKAERTLDTTYASYKLAFSVIDGEEYVNNKGRVINLDVSSEIITYKVRVTLGDVSEEITLATCIPSKYAK